MDGVFTALREVISGILARIRRVAIGGEPGSRWCAGCGTAITMIPPV